MARIRYIEISHFRGIESLQWAPSNGLNCLIGSGDSGKTTILNAIDFCLGARRNLQISDADFYQLDTTKPVSISVTIGDLGDTLKSMETYGPFLRGYRAPNGIEDEPGAGLETVLTVNLTIKDDLEPIWSMVSERSLKEGLLRSMSWGDRTQISPTRLGVGVEQNLTWRRGSVLTRLTDNNAATPALAHVSRDARIGFGDKAETQLGDTLNIATATAHELGIPVGQAVRALLDPQSVSLSAGTISLHSEIGVPLNSLGLGSTRLFVAGLQRKAANSASIILVDELEHGLEPHRICRLLNSLGSKENAPPLQVFMTTHSPVALRELSGAQLFVIRQYEHTHDVVEVGTDEGVQATIRVTPEAFLAQSVLVCEGASEVGLMRGLDQYRVTENKASINALAVGLVDANGVANIYKRVDAFSRLNYRVAVLRDDDVQPKAEDEKAFKASGGVVNVWRPGMRLEDELFISLTDNGVRKMINYAIDLHGEKLIEDHIKSVSQGARGLSSCTPPYDSGTRSLLGKAAAIKKAGWFKSVSWMEEVAREIVGPELDKCDAGFQKIIGGIFDWVDNV